MDNGNNGSSIANKGEITLKELVLTIGKLKKYLLSKWAYILCAGVLGASLGLTYSFITKPIYKAELSFALEDDKSLGGGMGTALGLASQFGIDLGGGSAGGAFSGDNLLELMRSRLMVENTLLSSVNINGKKQTLAELYISFNKLRDKWRNKPESDVQFLPEGDRLKFTLKQDSILGGFYKNIIRENLLVDKIDKKLNIITVTVDSKDELFSKYFTEILVKTVSDFYIDTKTKKSIQNVTILQRQVDSVRRELNSAITGVATSSDNNPNANPALQILKTSSQKRQVEVQANTAILTQLVANLEIAKISLRKETPLIQVIDRPILPLEKQSFGKLKGLVLGGFVGGAIYIAILLINIVFKKMLQ